MSPQQTIAHYRITSKLGEGGMGEVWRATDTKLGRDVAIKILPESFAQDADRLARFTREAQVLASLNHPNIAAIYGVEERALVMELVEGETLHGRLPLETALDYAKQVASALEAAHEKGIVHRDLKPANIKITPEGVVKVLDFGLAAMTQPAGSGSADASVSPTLTISPTRAGMILGTAGYMSPEQARGKPVDKRADIWAFGVVLYEMLAGGQLFIGETVSDTLAAVLTREPDWNRVPVEARRLLQRCLEKDPKRRLRDIGDIGLLLDEAPATPVTRAPGRLPWAVAGVFAIAAAIALWAPWHAGPGLQPLVRLDVDLGSDVSLGSPRGSDTVLSPDGTRLVYVSKSRLFTRRLDQRTATEMAGTEGAFAPFFSPDGQWVAFFTASELKKVFVQGGAALPLCNALRGSGGSWGVDGNIIVASGLEGLSRISSAGGPATALTERAVHRWPQILPGGNAVLFTAFSVPDETDGANIEVMSLKDRRRKILQQGGTFGRFVPSGHLVYLHRGTMFAAPLDLDRLEIHGTPVPVLEEVAYNGFGSAQFDFSGTGTLVYRSGRASGQLTLQWLDGAGKAQPLPARPGNYQYPRLSPDGSRMALGLAGDIWVYELRRDTLTRLTQGMAANNPVWTPDGRHIVFRGSAGMNWIRSDGSAKPQPLTQSKNLQFPISFSPNARWLAFSELGPEGVLGLWTAPVESDGRGLQAGKPEVFFAQAPFNIHNARFSPDGRWLAYSSNESATDQVYVRAFPDRGGKWQISKDGGMYPIFSPNGRELFFRNLDNQVMVAAYTVKGDSFIAEKPQIWSATPMANLGALRNYDLAPDGKRIIAIMPVESSEDQQARNHVTFLFNFFDELRRRVPVK
jgi:serine/threonine-protein kinase